jgi:hypothetical protein
LWKIEKALENQRMKLLVKTAPKHLKLPQVWLTTMYDFHKFLCFEVVPKVSSITILSSAEYTLFFIQSIFTDLLKDSNKENG